MLNTKFSFFLLFFMILMTIHRIIEIVIFSKVKEKGIIYKEWTFLALAVIHIAVGILSITEYFLIKKNINYLITSIGLILFFSALILRNMAIISLGKYYSIHIEIRNNHKLITNGIYKYMVHPYYFAVSSEVLSIPLISNSCYTLFFALFFYLPLVLFRMFCEEKIMINRFGDLYLEYRKQKSLFSIIGHS